MATTTLAGTILRLGADVILHSDGAFRTPSGTVKRVRRDDVILPYSHVRRLQQMTVTLQDGTSRQGFHQQAGRCNPAMLTAALQQQQQAVADKTAAKTRTARFVRPMTMAEAFEHPVFGANLRGLTLDKVFGKAE